jgi:hypothetical protein
MSGMGDKGITKERFYGIMPSEILTKSINGNGDSISARKPHLVETI